VWKIISMPLEKTRTFADASALTRWANFTPPFPSTSLPQKLQFPDRRFMRQEELSAAGIRTRCDSGREISAP
jgi:hypothetical protein